MIQLQAQKNGVRVSSRYGETVRTADGAKGTVMTRLSPINETRTVRRCARLAAGAPRTGTYNRLSERKRSSLTSSDSSEPADHHSTRTSFGRAFPAARASAG